MTTPRNRSVFKAFAMLRSFRNPDEWLSSSELSRRSNLPEASGYRLIQTLEEIGAVVRGPCRRYRPGMLLVSLSENVVIADLLREAAQKILSELAERVNATVHLGILEGGMVTYVAKATGPTSFQTETQAGAQLEGYCSGLGKVLLAALPSDQLDAILSDGDLVALTSTTITEQSVLRTHLAQVRAAGFAIDDREFRADMSCLAVPVFDDRRRTVAALSASESALDMTSERREQLRQELMAAAALISRKVWPAGHPMDFGGKTRIDHAA